MHDPDRDRDSALAAVVEGRCGRPFDWLGIHPQGDPSSPGRVVRAFLPWAGLAILLSVAGIWLLSQPMEMRGTMMGG